MARFTACNSDTGSNSSEDEDDHTSSREVPRATAIVEPEPDAESDDVDDGPSSSSSSSSEMQEEELRSTPPARRTISRKQDRNALIEDENGEIRFAHEVHVRVSPPSSSSSSPPAKTRLNNSRDDPTIIPWAKHVGVDAQTMHVMQTSLFRMPEEAATLKALQQAPKPAPAVRLDVSTRNQAVNRKHSRDSDGDGLRTDSRERPSFAHNVDPPIFRPSRKYARVEIKSSIVNGNEGVYFDAGLSMGRSFRVGWGPGGRLIHSGSICSPFATSKTTANSSIVFVTNVLSAVTRSGQDQNKTAPSVLTPSALSSKLLQHHLTHTTISRDDFGIPFAHPTILSSSSSSAPHSSPPTWNYAPAASSDPLNFASFALLFPSTDASSLAPIFRLGSALFDPIDLQFNRSRGTTDGTSITPDIRNRVQLLRRKKALSKWLEEVVKPSVDSDLRSEANGSNVAYTPADAAFTHLTGYQVSEACSAAADGGYLKLSTLISQAGGDDLYKNDIIAQLDIWKNEKLAPGSSSGLGNPQNGLVERSVWKVYNILGGLITSEGQEGKSEDSLYAGLDWKRTFGLCLWYGTSVDSSVADAVNVYEGILSQSSQSTSNQIAQPIPKWAISKKSLPPSSLASSRLGLFISSFAKDQTPDDPLFALIKLCADPTLSLSKALNPLSFAPSGLDWGIGMCWHLYIILSRIMRVRDFADRGRSGAKSKAKPPMNGFVGNDEDDEEPSEGHSPTADLLTSSYALELESWGMIQEAVFVLLHLEGSVGREKAIKDLLARSGHKLDNWTALGLAGTLKLPMSWIDEAKALHALDDGNIFSAYELYLSAQMYNSAHNLAILELAPDAIIRKDLELLRNLFTRFDSDGKKDKIEHWFVRGKVLLDYVDTMTLLPKLLEEVAAENEEAETMIDGSQAAAIDDLAKRIPKIVGLLPDIFFRGRSTDDRHPAAVEEMTKDLLKLAERANPDLLSQVQRPTLGTLDGAAKINLVRGMGYSRFLQSIAV
ncbi:hypothetical protein BYT27DRAFT_7081395 [Phlegmacium glaucopus]|nr:hypothetical protein BYT27DRAFT_7081395 [Phlegmacium glaucopus]